MKPHVLLIFTACVCAAYGWARDMRHGSPGPRGPGPHPLVLPRAQCFGLARRTRPMKVEIPMLYNVKTGQTSPLPKFLYTVDQNVINKMESDGWEVMTKSAHVPHHVYERVPVCCPKDPACQQGRQTVASTAASQGPCANGGQLVYRDGQQMCECPPGFTGTYCQHPDPRAQPKGVTYPVGPRILVAAAPSRFHDMMKEAEIWRQMVLNAQHNQMSSRGSAPMLTPKDHMLAAVAGPWGQQAAMWHQQALKAKMSQLQGMFRRNQGVQNSQMSPHDMIQLVQARGGNPHRAMDTRGGQLPPHVMKAMYSIQQQELRRRQMTNPYSNIGPSRQGYNQHMLAILQRLQDEQRANVNLYNNIPPQGVFTPEARTPWDLDPFSRQTPSYMNDPRMSGGSDRERQLVARALYQHMLNQQRARLSSRNDVMTRPPISTAGYPSPIPSPPLDGVNQPRPFDEVPAQDGINQSEQGMTDQSPIGMDGPMNDQPSLPMGGPMNHQSSVSLGGPMNDQPSLQMGGPMNGQPPMPMGGPMNGQVPPPMGGANMRPQRPSPEEVEQIKACQVTLTPKLDICMQDYDLTVEQFMNPDHMDKARAVCENSQLIGQCVMQQDMACGDQQETIMVTRKMINSVLQMMGMICQQIMARGDMPISPMQGGPQQPLGSPIPPQPPMGGPSPTLNTPEVPPLSSVGAEPEGEEMGQSPTMEVAPTQGPVAQATQSTDEGKKTTPVQKTDVAPEDTADPQNQAHTGHDSAHPVSKQLEVMGYPLWLVITLALVLFAAVLLAGVIVCMCLKRRTHSKSVELNREIEKMPSPLDQKTCTIGIPPPQYTTTAVPQTDDGLALPQLDLGEDTVTVPLDDEETDQKPSLEEDADDESDEKDDTKKEKN